MWCFYLQQPGCLGCREGLPRDSEEMSKGNFKRTEKEKRAGKTIIDHFIQYLVKIGGKKFRVLETNYQGYCGNLKLANDILDGLISKTDNKQLNAINWINNFRVLAQRYNLLESGGLDTHGKTLLEHK